MQQNNVLNYITEKRRKNKKIDVCTSANLWKFIKKYFLLIKFAKIMVGALSKRNYN